MTAENQAQLGVQRILAGGAILLFAGALLYSLFFMFRSIDDETRVESYVAAIEQLLPEIKKGDRILIHPPWREDVGQAIASSQSLPAGASVTTALSLPHGAPLKRIWVLHDGSAPLPRSLLRRMDDIQKKATGPIEVLFFDAASVSKDVNQLLDALLPGAEVTVFSADGTRTDCLYRPNENRHACPGLPDWMYVGTYEVTADGKQHLCVWNHPTTNGRVVTRFAQVELPAAFEISHAFSDRATSLSEGAAVELEMRIDDKSVARIVHPNRKGWLTDTVRVPSPFNSTPSTKMSEIEVEVRTKKDGMRHFCWSIRALERVK